MTPKAPLTGSGCREHSYGGFGGGHPHSLLHALDPLIRKEWADCPGPSSSGCLLGRGSRPVVQHRLLAMALAAVLAAVEDLANRVRYASGTRVRQVVGRSDDQPQVRLGLSKETVSVPSALKVKWATSWKVMVLPSEPVAWRWRSSSAGSSSSCRGSSYAR